MVNHWCDSGFPEPTIDDEMDNADALPNRYENVIKKCRSVVAGFAGLSHH